MAVSKPKGSLFSNMLKSKKLSEKMHLARSLDVHM